MASGHRAGDLGTRGAAVVEQLALLQGSIARLRGHLLLATGAQQSGDSAEGVAARLNRRLPHEGSLLPDSSRSDSAATASSRSANLYSGDVSNSFRSGRSLSIGSDSMTIMISPQGSSAVKKLVVSWRSNSGSVASMHRKNRSTLARSNRGTLNKG